MVDDEELIASMLQKALTRLYYAVDFTPNPAAALALVRSELGTQKCYRTQFSVSLDTERDELKPTDRPEVAWSIARPAELAKEDAVATDESGLFRSGPALELAFPLNCGGQIVDCLGIDQSRSDVVMSMLAAESQPVFAQAFTQIAGLSDVVSGIG